MSARVARNALKSFGNFSASLLGASADIFSRGLAVDRLPERRDYMASFATVATVALFVAGSLATTDYVIKTFDPRFDPVQTPQRAAIIFILFGLPFSLYMRVRGWTRIEPAIISSISLFIPIAFVSLAAVVLFGPGLAGFPDVNTPESGKAFAKMVYVQILRALPTVMMAPFAFWWILTRLFEPRSL